MQLADVAPEYTPALRLLVERLVDLLPVAWDHYYHRDMRGSQSIKAVLPTLASKLRMRDWRALGREPRHMIIPLKRSTQ